MKDLRYKVEAEHTAKGLPIYVVVDTMTGEWMSVWDCPLWAEKKAKEMNERSIKLS